MKLESLEYRFAAPGARIPEAVIIEKMVIGSIINNGTEAFSEAYKIIKSSMFYDDMNKHIFKVFEDMYRAGKPIGLQYLVQEIKDRGEDSVYTPGVIVGLLNEETGISNLEKQCRSIAEKYLMRHILSRSGDVQRRIYDNAPLDDILNELSLLDDEISNFFTGDENGFTMPEVLKETLKLQDIKINRYRTGENPGISTGFRILDNRIGGFMPGTLTILGGRTGSGKTSLSIHFAEIASKNKIPVLFFSFEMLVTQVGEILLSRNSGINRTILRDGKTTDDEISLIHRQAITILEKMNFKVFDNPNYTVYQMESIIKRHVKRYGTAFVIVDYLQLVQVSPDEKKISREQQVSGISRNLKKIANSLKIPILALAQLNREAASGAEPQLKDLRESGAIEQDADAVLLLWKPALSGFDFDLPGVNPEQVIRIKIAKNRHGATGEADIQENGQYTNFSQITT